MKVIVVGMGRMGMGLSLSLEKKGHTVTVIDKDAEALGGLGNNFKGTKVEGFVFDKDVLIKAKIDRVDAVVACTGSDEINAVIARVARNIYLVPRVIARLYDPKKADIYRRLGIQTISTTAWGIERATEMITFNSLDSVYEMGDGNVNLVRIEIPHLLVGHKVHDLSIHGEIQVVTINRNGQAFIPMAGTIFEPEDILYISVVCSATNKLKNMLDLAH
ncbi:potassium channel family protein [Parasporobacterium paucivorans]|uniref:Trk system potassium uptake protein TrkA n=1 Tax=Parasporobacterium paucivorans DSM 15970 TaxID=1122934 RepID=A0A1M6HYV0_9FIRM|nr:TrkA family potassium uptake protein [Parasporobacterium paucivorans]SHJ27352.1 trk system potassium uptake protein TrkA [Parasporobacterium paucivorans DSM 15970]